MMGSGYDVAEELMEELKQSMRLDLGLYQIFRDIFFVPMDSFGTRLLRILTVPDCSERLLGTLFNHEERSYEQNHSA